MKNQTKKNEDCEKILREAYLHRQVSMPGEEWYQMVMNEARRGRGPADVSVLFEMETTAWKLGWVAATAAAVIAIVSFATMPSQDRLAWDLYKNGVVSEWCIRTGVSSR